jgi:hypothetical protein
MGGIMMDLNTAYNPITGDAAALKDAKNALKGTGGTMAGLKNASNPAATPLANADPGNTNPSQPVEPTIRTQQWSVNAYSKVVPAMAYKLESGATTETIIDKDAPYSIINKWSLMSYKGRILDTKPSADKAIWGAEQSLYTKPLYTAASDELNPTAATIIRKCRDNGAPGYQYNSGDFAYCKYYGKIPNNYMVTLRRFPTPCEDDIINATGLDATGAVRKKEQADIARAVTWMSEASENKLSEILKFNVGYSWDDLESEVQTITPNQPDRGSVGNFINSSPFLSNVENTANGVSPYQAANVEAHGSGWDPMKETFPNHALGPYNVIKNVRVRKTGLTFEQEIKLTFHYDLRAIGRVDPKMAMLDIMANMLVLTYNNGHFWGGATRYTSSGTVKQPFGDMSKLAQGNIGEYFGSLADSFSKATTNLTSGGFMESLKKIGGNLLGGSLMNLFGKPSGTEAAKAFLTGDSTGAWHVTVGNPLNPIAVIGNLTCDSTDFEFDGPLGYEDFPSKLKVVITLKPGRYRDKGDIESMFNSGRGRIYLTPKGQKNTDQETIVDAYGKKVPQKGDNKSKGRGASGARGGAATGGGTYDDEVTISDAYNNNDFTQKMKDFANG